LDFCGTKSVIHSSYQGYIKKILTYTFLFALRPNQHIRSPLNIYFLLVLFIIIDPCVTNDYDVSEERFFLLLCLCTSTPGQGKDSHSQPSNNLRKEEEQLRYFVIIFKTKYSSLRL